MHDEAENWENEVNRVLGEELKEPAEPVEVEEVKGHEVHEVLEKPVEIKVPEPMMKLEKVPMKEPVIAKAHSTVNHGLQSAEPQ